MNTLRHSLRQLARSPAFTILAVLSLAIGIGINTTLFSAMDAAFLRPLPVPVFVSPSPSPSDDVDVVDVLFPSRTRMIPSKGARVIEDTALPLLIGSCRPLMRRKPEPMEIVFELRVAFASAMPFSNSRWKTLASLLKTYTESNQTCESSRPSPNLSVVVADFVGRNVSTNRRHLLLTATR